MDRLALERFLPYRLNRLAAAISLRGRAVYRLRYDLTVPEWRVLATLGQFGEQTAKAVGSHSSMHKTKVSRAVKALADRRWLARRTNEGDRREELLCLTREGKRAYAALVPEMLAFERELLTALGPDRAGRVLRAMDDLETALSVGA